MKERTQNSKTRGTFSARRESSLTAKTQAKTAAEEGVELASSESTASSVLVLEVWKPGLRSKKVVRNRAPSAPRRPGKPDAWHEGNKGCCRCLLAPKELQIHTRERRDREFSAKQNNTAQNEQSHQYIKRPYSKAIIFGGVPIILFDSDQSTGVRKKYSAILNILAKINSRILGYDSKHILTILYPLASHGCTAHS
ncbi:hypothetical protein TSAR_006725 [Trichomalopsis sarcophagae]|uniref:Uncharacterized protein n=1 Tax=Trichomalopsis sarcophagae TaxID=543379 RepID=A0A232EN67_9HYME|nr:hypothetical protein TSAR_006725 [Trichomalopsis sarcophagae]